MTSAAPARPAYLQTGWTGGRNPWAIALVVTMATFMEVLDTSIAHVSLPHIAGNLSVTQDESTWVLTSYLVSNAIILPISGWIASKVGRKRFYMTCVSLFTISSFLCGMAPSLAWLVVFRILQGLGGATGAKFSVLPPENASGNYVKVVQRIPVRIKIDPGQPQMDRLRSGMSVEPTIKVR